jgi:hypothetical protein
MNNITPSFKDTRATLCIDDVRKNGEIKGLIEHIDYLRFKLCDNWDGIKDTINFIRLQVAINDANFLLKQMQFAFNALQNLDSKHE